VDRIELRLIRKASGRAWMLSLGGDRLADQPAFKSALKAVAGVLTVGGGSDLCRLCFAKNYPRRRRRVCV